MDTTTTTTATTTDFDLPVTRTNLASPSTCFRGTNTPVQDAIQISIMGRTEVDGVPVRSARPLEVVTALALAGGAMQKSGLTRRIYSDLSSPSAIPTQCYRARRLGVRIDHDDLTGRYVLRSPVDIDALTIARLLGDGDVRRALCLWAGPCLPRSDSPLAHALRLRLEAVLINAVISSDDPDLARAAARVVDSPELSDHLAEGDLVADILSVSHRRGGR